MTAALLLSVVCCLHQPSPAQAPNFAAFPFERLCLECSSSSSGGGHSYVVARVSAISSAPPTSNRHQHQPSTATGDSSQQPGSRPASCVMCHANMPGQCQLLQRASRVIYDPAVCCSQAAVAPQPSRDATRAAAPCSTAAGSVVNIDFCRQFTRPPRCWPRTRRRAARWKWRK